MKYNTYIIFTLFSFILIEGCSKQSTITEKPTISTKTDQKVQDIFNFSQLTKEQTDAAAKFKTCKNKDKFTYWNILNGAFPHPKPDPKTILGEPSFKMTKTQVIQYIGKPSSIIVKDEMESLHYDFGINDGIERTAFVHIKDGFVWWFGESHGTMSNKK